MRHSIVISRRFCGPPDTGNGGYVCGLVAGFIGGTAEITLRQPPPLDKLLTVERIDDNKVLVRDGDKTVAEGRPAELEISIPHPPTFAEAVEASKFSAALRKTPFSNCFVCGGERAEGDGLRIHAGPVLGNAMVAAPWIPHTSLADAAGRVRPEFLWAALDCPGAYACISEHTQVMLLGRMTADIDNRIRPGHHCIVTGWQIATDGRKIYAGSAVFSQTGELCAKAKSTFIVLKDPGSLAI